MAEEGFTSFLCPSCGTEIEASLDMCGVETECPACGTNFIVPAPDATSDDVVRYGDNKNSTTQSQAIKSRTIRIELSDL